MLQVIDGNGNDGGTAVGKETMKKERVIILENVLCRDGQVVVGNFLKANKFRLADIPRFVKYDMQYFFSKTSSYIYYKQVK